MATSNNSQMLIGQSRQKAHNYAFVSLIIVFCLFSIRPTPKVPPPATTLCTVAVFSPRRKQIERDLDPDRDQFFATLISQHERELPLIKSALTVLSLMELIYLTGVVCGVHLFYKMGADFHGLHCFSEATQ